MFRDEKTGRFVKAEIKDSRNLEDFDYQVYSKVLNKPFDTIEELRAAEKEYNEAQAEKNRKLEEKKLDAKNVDESYKALLNVKKQCAEEINKVKLSSKAKIKEAENNYTEKLNEFIKKYGSYHTSYYTTTDFDSWADLINKFFDAI